MPDDKVLRCECGYEAVAADDARLVEDIRRHALEAHGIAFSVEEALLVVLRSELDLSRDSIDTGTRDLRMSKGGSP